MSSARAVASLRPRAIQRFVSHSPSAVPTGPPEKKARPVATPTSRTLQPQVRSNSAVFQRTSEPSVTVQPEPTNSKPNARQC